MNMAGRYADGGLDILMFLMLLAFLLRLSTVI